MGKIREKPDQLQNLSDWKNFDPQNREVTIVVHDDQHWPDIFIRITTKNAETTTVLNKLIEAGVRLKIGKHTLDTPQLERLRQTITQQLSDQNIGKPGGLRVKEFFEDMLEKSIMDVLEGGDATPQNA
jgi:hypothetical protein